MNKHTDQSETMVVTDPSEVTQLTLWGSINEAEIMAMELMRTEKGCTICIRMVDRALYEDVVQEKSSEFFDNLAQRVLDTGVLATQSFEHEGSPICDGDKYLVKISTRQGCASREYYCPDEANDPKINEVTKLIKQLVQHFEPREWEYTSAYIEREEQMERGSLQNSGRVVCQQLKKRLERSGLECPHCKRHTKRMKFFARQSCFVCLECGSSFGPAE
jgi:hypothetical protein